MHERKMAIGNLGKPVGDPSLVEFNFMEERQGFLSLGGIYLEVVFAPMRTVKPHRLRKAFERIENMMCFRGRRALDERANQIG